MDSVDVDKQKVEKVERFERFDISVIRNELEFVDFSYVLESKCPIIFDTNFLFSTFQFRVDVIAELQRIVARTFSLFIYEGTIDELCNLQLKTTPNKKFLPLIRTMLKRYGFKVIRSSEKYVDNAILSELSEKVYIATNDKGLKMKVKELGGKGILVRQKSYLEFF